MGRFFVWNLSNTGVGGRQGNFVAAGRRSPPTTKQRSSAVFRARPLKARLPSHAPDKKAPWGAFLFGIYRIRESGEARQLCCRRSEVSTDDKTAVIRCFPCASAQGATPVTCSRQKSAFQVLPPYTSGGAVQALRRRSLSQQSTTAPDTATKVSPCRQDCPIQSLPPCDAPHAKKCMF